ncbi:hypothetical protein ACFX2I_016277 [Malus domestica]
MFPGLMHEGGGMVGGGEDMQMQGHSHRGGRDPCLVLTFDPKPRLRWTADLHERFVDAVTQLGGSSSQTSFSPFSFNSIELRPRHALKMLPPLPFRYRVKCCAAGPPVSRPTQTNEMITKPRNLASPHRQSSRAMPNTEEPEIPEAGPTF